MRGKSSSSKSRNAGPEKSKEPNLSSAYIRSLVKQLSSSRTRDSSNLIEHESLEGDGITSSRSDKREKSYQPRQDRKQVRRRLHTIRPYQERLLNMAEARREIVTALKFHRASMKQASEKQLLEARPEIHAFGPTSFHQLTYSEEDEARLKSRRHCESETVPNNYPSIYLDNFSSSPGFYSPYSWPVPHIQENFNFPLPTQTLGLNLNLQSFNTVDSTAFHSSSSSASNSSSPLSVAAEIPSVGQTNLVTAEVADSGLHPSMDDKEMGEIRSIGEQHEMEWNDTLNLVNSAWWFKFLKSMEKLPENQKGRDFLNFPVEEAVEFPAWMNANENDFCSDDYVQDHALPCMDIEEIDGMDEEWLD